MAVELQNRTLFEFQNHMNHMYALGLTFHWLVKYINSIVRSFAASCCASIVNSVPHSYFRVVMQQLCCVWLPLLRVQQACRELQKVKPDGQSACLFAIVDQLMLFVL